MKDILKPYVERMIRELSGTSLLSAAFKRVFMKKNILVPKEQILYQILGSGIFRNERSKLIGKTPLINYRYCIAKPGRHYAQAHHVPG